MALNTNVVIKLHFPDASVDEFEVRGRQTIIELKQQIAVRASYQKCAQTRGISPEDFQLATTQDKGSVFRTENILVIAAYDAARTGPRSKNPSITLFIHLVNTQGPALHQPKNFGKLIKVLPDIPPRNLRDTGVAPVARTPLTNLFGEGSGAESPPTSTVTNSTPNPTSTPAPAPASSGVIGPTRSTAKRAITESFFNPKPDSSPAASPSQSDDALTASSEGDPNEIKFWLCIGRQNGCMIKVQSSTVQSISAFKQSTISQMQEFIKEIEQNDIVITKTHDAPPVRLPNNSILYHDAFINQQLQNQQVPMLGLAPPAVPSLQPNPPPRITSSPNNSAGDLRNSQGVGLGLFGLHTASPNVRKNKHTKEIIKIPSSFELVESKDLDKTVNAMIESILVSSFTRQRNHFKDDDEALALKQSVFPIAKTLQPEIRMNRIFATTTHHTWPEFLPKQFKVMFYYWVPNTSKEINCQPTARVGDLITNLLQTSHLGSIKTKTMDDIVMKFADFNEFLLPDTIIGSVEHIRELLKKRIPINLCLVEKSTLQTLYSNKITYQDEYRAKTDGDYFDPVHYGKPYAVDIPTYAGTSTLDFKYNFQIRILEVENFAMYFPQYLVQGQINHFDVEVGIYHGQTLLEDHFSCKPKTNDLQFDEWIGSKLVKISQLPRAAKLCITLHVKNYKESIPLAWVNFQLFSHENALRFGSFSLPMWLNGKANPLANCAVNMESSKPLTLHIELPGYAKLRVYYPELSHLLYQPGDKVQPDPSMVLNPKIDDVIKQDPLYPLTDTEKKSLWDNRRLLMCIPSALPKVLHTVDWKDFTQAQEMIKLVGEWAPLSGRDALQLLDAHYPIPEVREYAVNCLRLMSDVEIADYMLQLIQVLKYEPYHNCALSRFLLQRALLNRERIGHLFFWNIKAELAIPSISERYTLLLEAYLIGCGNHLIELHKQTDLVERLGRVAELVKAKKKGRKQLLHKELSDLRFESVMSLPINSALSVNGLDVPKCKYMDSFTVPLWLEFKGADQNASPLKVIFKSGDDLRADILTLQIFRVMDKLWKDNGLDLNLSPYICTATNVEAGMIEVVPKSVTTASIQKVQGVVTGALKKTPLAKWLREQNPSDYEYDQAVDNFVRSLAGYCVATYVIGIGDRHNDNIMITTSGHLFHIDFAHFLGNVQMWQGIKRERAPFVLTPEFLYVMGKKRSPKFHQFVSNCTTAFNILRKHASLFINLFSMMLSTGIPELKCDEDINYLRNAFVLGRTDAEAVTYFEGLIEESLNTKATQVNFLIHNLAHPT